MTGWVVGRAGLWVGSTFLGLGWRYQPLAPGHPTSGSICDIGVNFASTTSHEQYKSSKPILEFKTDTLLTSHWASTEMPFIWLGEGWGWAIIKYGLKGGCLFKGGQLLNVVYFFFFLNFQTCFMNLSVNSHVDPNALALSVMFSLVWESNVGFSIKQLMKIHKWFLTWNGFTSIPPLFLFFTAAKSLSTIWSVM